MFRALCSSNGRLNDFELSNQHNWCEPALLRLLVTNVNPTVGHFLLAHNTMIVADIRQCIDGDIIPSLGHRDLLVIESRSVVALQLRL